MKQGEARAEQPTENEVTEALIESAGDANKSKYWQVPNNFFKKIRQLSLNDVRNKCLQLAAALVDQHNANVILTERLEVASAELKELRVKINKASDGLEQVSDSTNQETVHE